ncbi:MAG: right-handed parallel beta-helix repeat-containing protein [Deltaproteobacteria bacterium]|nr:right-handed parallel beta-helix repeat-containing protein [Deltaproteobacteria bacterium]
MSRAIARRSASKRRGSGRLLALSAGFALLACVGCEQGVALAGRGDLDAPTRPEDTAPEGVGDEAGGVDADTASDSEVDAGPDADAEAEADTDAEAGEDADADEDAPDVVPLPTCASMTADLVVPRDADGIQAAIDMAEPGAVICVEAGEYREQLHLGEKPVWIVGVAGPAATIVDGGGEGVVVWIGAPAGPDTVLEGFTICNGWNDSGFAGGIEINNASPVLRHLVVRDNGAIVGAAGGLHISGTSSPTIADSIIAGNEAAGWGGGLTIEGGRVTLQNVLVIGNGDDGAYGGGLLVDGDASSSLTATNVIVAGNSQGIWLRGENEVTLTNVIVARNRGEGLLAHGNGPMTFRNVSVTHNHGFGLRNDIGSTMSVSRCNSWGNVEVAWDGPDDVVGYTGDWAAGGNLSVDPGYLDVSGDNPLLWNFHLSPDSPLVDAGDVAVPDPDGGRSDIGAWGGPEADDWDLDADGHPSWWMPGPYDPLRDPALGLDCDDFRIAVGPGSGC